MENASKALLMAGGILIAILIEAIWENLKMIWKDKFQEGNDYSVSFKVMAKPPYRVIIPL